VDLAYERRCCGRIRTERILDRGDTLDLLVLDDIRGMYARKAGTHRLNALLFWRSRVEGDRDPARPRVGACAYFPGIHIHLPVFLPDLGLEDLREFDLPQPILPAEWFRNPTESDWMTVHPGGMIRPWGARGPRPWILDERYPDL
jgi:hypothetical protein